jgi:NodT family efflux transporter outer membrane factor (OMF) lipoprotein
LTGKSRILLAQNAPGVLAGIAPRDARKLSPRLRTSLKKFNRTLTGTGFAIIMMLTGCAVGPDFRAPEPPEVTGYLGRSDAIDRATPRVVPGDLPSRWWELFRSRALSRLVEEGIEHNADLKSAEAAIRVAYANAKAARGSLFPAVDGSFNPTRQQVAPCCNTSQPPNGENLYTLVTAQLSVSYTLDVWGGIRRQVEAADALAEVAEFQREATYLTLTSNIALAAISEASLRGQIAATQRIIGLQTNLLGIMRKQVEAGQIAAPDVAQQETALAQAQLLLPPLEKQLFQQRHLLSVLTGRFPSDGVGSIFAPNSLSMPHRIPLTLPASLILQRPDIRVAQANMRQANAQVGVAIANRLPNITLSGNVGSQAMAMAQLFGPQTGLWTIAGNLAQPIFNAGTLKNKQVAAEETFNQVAETYRGVVLTAFQNVADALRALQADTKALAAATAAERAAARSFELTQKQIERGQYSVQTLLTAQQAFLQTSIARVQSEAQLLSDTVLLFQALGGGWWNRPDPVPTAVEGVIVTEPVKKPDVTK